MRHTAMIMKNRFLGQVAVVTLLAGASAGCSADVTRFGDMFEPTSNRAAIVQNDGMMTGSLPPAQAAPTGQVVASTLPPAPGAVVNTGPYTRPPVTAAAPVATMPATPAVPVASAVAAAPAARNGWSATGGTAVSVAPGETLQVLSRRYGVPADAIAAANGMAPGAPLQPGQRVVIPTYTYGSGKAQAVAAAATPAGAAAGQVYVVKPGDSLGRIANAHGMRSKELAAANGIDPTAPIKIGQKLRIPTAAPAATKVAALDQGTMTDAAAPMPRAAAAAAAPLQAPAPQVPAQAPLQQPVATTPAAPAVPAQPTQQPAQPATQIATAPATKAPEINTGTGVESAKSGSFRWPVRGRVISGYGVKASGERNDGINIEVPEGTPIKAAEGGTVIYAGNELKGYGNLVLIKHPNGMVSAYAHASELLVKRDDVIMRGQTIGKVGATGNVARPQLHFELRNGNRPVDPLPMLNG